jgi:citrate synthase
MSTTATEIGFVTVPRGLAGVLVTDTELGDVRGDEGLYHYRQYSAIDVATSVPFEAAWHLFLHGDLPDGPQLHQFRERVGRLRALPPEVVDALPVICRSATDPLQVLRTALSLLGSTLGLRPLYDSTQPEKLDAALRMAAAAPTILATAHRVGRGLEPVAPEPSLGHAEDYVRMTTGTLPADRDVRAVEQYLTSTIDHGFNASTFTARVVASTGADLAACLVAALGSFSGPLHGGAPSRALQSLDEIGTADRAEGYVRAKLAAGQRMMGFGHAVYRTADPRSEMLKGIARSYDSDLGRLAEQVEATVERVLAEVKPDRPLRTNVEYYAGVVLKLAGLDPAMFTPTFCVARVVGWAANALEQSRDPKIIRPSARYVGPPPPQPVP